MESRGADREWRDSEAGGGKMGRNDLPIRGRKVVDSDDDGDVVMSVSGASRKSRV